MFRTSFRLPFRLLGIPLFVDISFLIVLPLMVWATSHSISQLVQSPQLGLTFDPADFAGATGLVLGLVSVLGLFTSVILHELGHCVMAQRYGVTVRRITLWFLGGMAEFEEMPRQRGAEAVVGIAGPIVSFILAGLAWAALLFIPRTIPALWVIVWYLGALNLMLGLFNLLPALPLDGGRILRSLLALKMPHPRATLIAGNTAKVLAIGLGLLGLMGGNFWMMIMAFFIFNAARNETRQSAVTELLQGYNVADLMNRNVISVPAGMPLGQLAHYALTQHHQSFPVVDEQGRLIGHIGLEQLPTADPASPIWHWMSTELQTIGQDAAALEAYKRMSLNESGRLIVVDHAGQMIGIITLADLLRAIQVRMLGAAAPSYKYQPPHYVSQPPIGYTISNGARDPQRYARPI